MVRSVSSARVSSLTPPTASRASRRNAPMAPGTVGMHRSTSNIRRSRLNPITYSMCCQRPSSPRRLPTFVLPETAPTSGRRRAPPGPASSPARRRCRRRRARGCRGAPRRCRCSGPRACRRSPGGSASRWGVRAPRPLAVPSVEPSSTTMISSSGYLLAASDRTAGPTPELLVERRDHDGDRGKVRGAERGGRDLLRVPSGQRQQQQRAQRCEGSQGDQANLSTSTMVSEVRTTPDASWPWRRCDVVARCQGEGASIAEVTVSKV